MSKTILISGSTSGIGASITQAMLNKNYQVIGLARDHAKLNNPHPHYYPYVIDFSKISTLENEFEIIHKTHPKIDIIIGCAGYGLFGELEQISIVQMQEMMNVNFLSQVILIKSFLPNFKRRKNGKIILMGSEAALSGRKKGSLYCASKFALRGFAESVRKECAPANIAVTFINPGLVKTPFFDKLSFQPGSAVENSILPQQIADVVSMLVELENNCVCEEINLQPMKNVIEKNVKAC